MELTCGASRPRRSDNGTAAQSYQLARTLRTEGKLEEAEAHAVAALDRASDRRQRAAVLTELAEIRLDRGRSSQARRNALAALDLAAEEGDLAEQVRALCLAGRSYLGTSEPLEARAFLERALAVAACLPEADAARARVLTLLGDGSRQGGHIYEAEECYRQALAAAERYFDPYHAEIAVICLRLAMLAEVSDAPAALEPFARRAYAIRCAQFGSTHPLTAAAQTGLALVLEGMGDTDDAGEKLLHALAIFDRHYAAGYYDLPVSADSWSDYATCRRYAVMHLVQAGRGKDACEFSERAARAIERALGRSHPIAKQVVGEHNSLKRRSPKGKVAIRYSPWEWWRTLSFGSR